MQSVINLIIELAESAAKEPRDLEAPALYDRGVLVEKLSSIIAMISRLLMMIRPR